MLPEVRLMLLVGPGVPLPVPGAVLDALESVEVTATAGAAAGFQLTFQVERDSPLNLLFLLSGGASIPLMRAVIAVTRGGGLPEVLIDGVLTHHQFTPGENGSPSRLTVTGEDLTRLMDKQDLSGVPYPAMPVEARVLTILGRYAMFGIVPVIIPALLSEVPLPTEKIPRHKGTDLAYLKELAEQVGYVFYIDPGPLPGMSRAYWGPDIKVGIPQPPLNVNLDSFTNVEGLNIAYDDRQAEQPVVNVMLPMLKTAIPIPVPDVSLINPPLGLVPPFPQKFTVLTGQSKGGPLQAALSGLARKSTSNENVTVTGNLDVARYGNILKPRGLVGLRGAGQAFDGLYYVRSVTHLLKRGEFKQRFTLTRGGLLPTVPGV